MNTPSNTMAASEPSAAPAVLSPTQPFLWSVRRELWENRSIYIAPAAAAGLFLFGYLISTVRLAKRTQAALALDPMHQQEIITKPYHLAEMLIMGAALIVAIFYCLDALHGERRDRSILFWKSLPVSDLTTVLSKASIPIVILPLLAFTLTVATQWIMLLLNLAALAGSGVSPATLWSNLHLFQMWGGLFFHLLAVHGIYYAPFYGWLLLVSAWAKRAPILWASLPVLVICFGEKIVFNSWHFAALLGSRLGGGADPSQLDPADAMVHSLRGFEFLNFAISPGLWVGLGIAAAFLAAAVRMRRNQGPI